METIYHYCSLDTFMQVIGNKTIRLSDLDKTNDYMEKRWGIELLQEVLNKELIQNSINMNLEENYWYSEDVHNHVGQLSKEINGYLSHQTLISCFSLENDQLGQWRAYGQDGVGMAVGFNYNYLKRLLKGYNEILIDKVVYKKHGQEKLIREKMFVPAMEGMWNMFQEDLVKCSDDFSTYFVEEFDCFCEKLDRDTEKVFTFLKNPAFAEEKEVRIVFNTGIHNEIESKYMKEKLNQQLEIGKNKEIILKPIQHQARGNKMVAYADLCFENCISSGIIKEVVIGPKSKVSESDVRQLLLSKGFDDDISIMTSKASYQ